MNSGSRFIVLVSIAGLFGWVFCDALFGSGMFAFRDAAHYYYPLFKFVQSEWVAGRVPLWNPYENLGVPLAANATASVFYPGKLIFACPLDYAWAYKLYIMAHVLLAAAAAYRLARHYGASVLAAGCCAISYAFSGNVLMQYANVVFLVGAAWLPLAVLAADRMLVERSLRHAAALAAVLALMVLGGDPQMACNAGLIAAAYAVWLWWRDGRVGTAHQSRTGGGQCPPYILLALAAAGALLLSAVQVLPSMELTARSNRAATDTARSLYEVPRFLGEEDAATRIADGLLCRNLDKRTHHEHVYHFSVGPWRLAEYLWPNFSGRQFPVHRRWLEVIPAEGRIWTPTLYMGVLPFLLALSAVCFGRKEAGPASFFSLLTLLAVLAAFGWFGLGWLVHEIRIAAGADPSGPWLVEAPVGGLYWLMTVLLPGYVQFRYPAKLLVVAALGLSLLSARGWDLAFSESSDRPRRLVLWLGAISLLAAVVAMAIRPMWIGWMSGVRSDILFGPLDATGAANDLLASFVQTGTICAIVWWLLGRVPNARRWVPAAALMLVAVDLAVANSWIVACAPADLWQGPKKGPGLICRNGPEGASHKLNLVPFSAQPVRLSGHRIWMPPIWKTTSSPNRLAEAVRWDRDTLRPNYNLAYRIAITNVHGTMMLKEKGEEKGEEKGRKGGQSPVSGAFSRAGPCRVVYYDPLRVEIQADLSEPGLIVLADQFYPGWQLQVVTAGQGSRLVPIERTGQRMRGARLDAGKHRLIFRYRPRSFLCGALLSGAGWITLLAAATLPWFGVASRKRDQV